VDTGGSGALHVANMQLQLIIIIIISIISEIWTVKKRTQALHMLR